MPRFAYKKSLVFAVPGGTLPRDGKTLVPLPPSLAKLECITLALSDFKGLPGGDCGGV